MPETISDSFKPAVPFQKRLFIGAVAICAGLYALWNNELRYDLAGAVQNTVAVQDIGDAVPGENVSFSGQLHLSEDINDQNVGSIPGYMAVRRVSEIYAWDRKKPSYHGDRWKLEWQNKPESNSRNETLTKHIKTRRLQAPSYALDDVSIDRDKLHFIDDYQPISTEALPWRNTKRRPTAITSEYFYFSDSGASHEEPQLGDQRVSYVGIPLPPLVTYFGRYNGESVVADSSHQRSGRVNKIIKNDGILHHLVSGDRDTAVNTVIEYQSHVKLMTRVGGVLVVVAGLYLLLQTVLGGLALIPVIGEFIAGSLFVTSVVVGGLISGLTITLGLLAAHLTAVAALFGAMLLGYYWLRQRALTVAE